jgi:hypothetical protein
MTWLALRLLRPYLVVAASIAAATTAYIFHAVAVVQLQLDRSGRPGCVDPNDCYPHGSALHAVLGLELCAAFVPPLLGLILGVPLFAREREDDTIAFVLTQSVSRRRWILTKFGWALAAGLTCSAAVAVTYRLVATRYTALASDTYELLQLLHLNNAAYMIAQTAVLVALAGVLGLRTGRTLRTLALSVVAGPFAVMLAAGLAIPLTYPLRSIPAPAGDLFVTDPFAYLTSAVAGVGVLVLVLLTARAGQAAHGPTPPTRSTR